MKGSDLGKAITKRARELGIKSIQVKPPTDTERAEQLREFHIHV